MALRVAFDTSVLVAGSVVGHAEEARAAVWLSAARDGHIEAFACQHAFAETWATLTAIPIEPRLPPDIARSVVERLSRHIKPVALRWGDYQGAMARCGARALRSGAIYDALHLVVAERTDARALLTFNVRHFTRLAAEDSSLRIVAPPDPAGFGDILDK
jgi:predicted nucleic acid-binding protein